MKNLIVLGGSGIGMIAVNVAETLGIYNVLGFLNDDKPVGSWVGKYNKVPVIGKTCDIDKYVKDENNVFFIAYVGMLKEKDVFEKISSFNIPMSRYATLIHPTAIIPKGFCEIGDGVLMGPNAQLSPDTTIGDNSIMLGGSFVGHDSTLRRFAHIATNAVVGANVDVGRGCHVGSNATIREKVKIGDFSLIGSGAVVLNDVQENSVMVGNPARLLKTKE